MKLKSLIGALITSGSLSVLMHYEGIKTKAYLDEAGVPTICYGHTTHVSMGDIATPEQCEQYLKDDLKPAQAAVARLVRVQLTQSQFDALTIFVFNVGSGNFQTSTMLRKINAGDMVGASQEFRRWNMLRDARTGQLRVSKGLINRREAEYQLFIKE